MPKLIKSSRFLIEKAPSPSINAPSALIADYLAVGESDLKFYLPIAEKTDDGEKGGRDVASHECNEYWSQDDKTNSDDIDFLIVPRYLRRGMAGTPVRTTVATGVYDFEWGIMPSSLGNILPAFGLYNPFDPAKFHFWGNTIDKIALSQTKSDRVKHNTTMVGTGGFENAPSGLATLPAEAVVDCTEGRKVVLKYTDDTSTLVNLSTLGGVQGWEFAHENNVKRGKRAPGDPAVAVNGVEAGYVRRVPRGNYRTSLSFTPLFEDLVAWTKSVTLKKMTNFSILIPGKKIATVSTVDYFNELEIIVPSFGFSTVTPAVDDEEAVTQIAVKPFEDPVTKGSFKVRLRTTETSFEGVSS